MLHCRTIVIVVAILIMTQFSFYETALAYSNADESITDVVPDTGNMNESGSNRTFSARFTIELATSSAEVYKSPQVATGTPQTIYVAAYISWRAGTGYSRVFTDSFTPSSAEPITTSKIFSFSVPSPSSWGNPVKMIIIAKYQNAPESSPNINFSGRGDVSQTDVPTPPSESNVTLGVGNTGFEGLGGFSGNVASANAISGTVTIDFTVLVSIFQNPLNGPYDPVPEGVGIWIDPNGESNPTQRIYGGTRLAGAYWASIGRPALPFNLPFSGSHTIGEDAPGVVVGGVALAWGAVPILGSNTVWGAQNSYTWFLPPKKIELTADVAQTGFSPVPTYEIFDTCSIKSTAKVIMRKLQTPDRISKYTWSWGDGDIETISGGNDTSKMTHLYDANLSSVRIYNANCSAIYKNSNSQTTQLSFPFNVRVKPLPRIQVPNTISITYNGQNVLYAGEDVSAMYHGIGNVSRVCQQNKENDYSIYYKFEDVQKEAGKNSAVSHKFTTLGRKVIKLYVKYKKAQVVGNSLVNSGPGYTHELLATRYVNVESQQVLENNAQQRITFSVKSGQLAPGQYIASTTLTLNAPEASITFNATANIFYAKRDENSNLELDQKHGVKAGSVKYRWKILDPDGKNAYENGYVKVEDASLLSYSVLPDISTTIKPLKIAFNTPFGTSKSPNRHYKVFIEAEYNEMAWKPVITKLSPVKEIITDWSESDSYKKNYVTRKIEYGTNDPNSSDKDFAFYSETKLSPPLNRETSYLGTDLLADGSLGMLVKVNDQIPAKITITGINSGTTGDPLDSTQVTVKLEDNNPDAQLETVKIVYRRFDEQTYSMSGLMTASSNETTNSYNNYIRLQPSETLPYQHMKKTELFNITTLDDTYSKKNSIAFYTKQDENLPNSFATTMTDLTVPDGGLPGVFNYTVKAYIDDGQTYFLEPPRRKITVTDNDPPELKITFVSLRDNTNIAYSVSGGLRDLLSEKTKMDWIAEGKSDLLFSGKSDELIEKEAFFSFPENTKFSAISHQRFLCSIDIIENVKSADNLKLQVMLDEDGTEKEFHVNVKSADGLKFKGNRPEYLFYMKPKKISWLKFKAYDKKDNIRSIKIPIEVLPETNFNIRVLKQDNQ